MVGYSNSLLVSIYIGLMVPVAVADGGDENTSIKRVLKSTADYPESSKAEGGENQRSHKLRGVSKADKRTPKKTTPKAGFGEVAAPGLKKAME